MVRKKDYFEFELNKNQLIVISVAFFLIVGSVLVIAINDDWEDNPVDARKVGHSPDEVVITINGENKTIQQAIDDGDLSGETITQNIIRIPGSEWTVIYSTAGVDLVSRCTSFTTNYRNVQPIIERGRLYTTVNDQGHGNYYYGTVLGYLDGYCIGEP